MWLLKKDMKFWSTEHPGREKAGWFLEHFTGEFRMVGGQLGNTHTKERNLPVSNQEKGKTSPFSFLHWLVLLKKEHSAWYYWLTIWGLNKPLWACISLNKLAFPRNSGGRATPLPAHLYPWQASYINTSTSCLSLCLLLNSFCTETLRTWASVSPDTK